MPLTRRRWLAQAGLLGLPLRSIAAAPTGPQARLAATWQAGAGTWHVGVLLATGHALRRLAQAEVPTRAHGLLELPDGALLALARRPGDWLLRWSPGSGRTEWTWAEPGFAFNGHAALSSDGRHLYTTETRLDSGEGVVGVRDAATLALLAHWPTHGRDPHALLLDIDGSLVIANGGILTLPETGRAKLALDRMDSSLVRLDPSSGALIGQWRLADARLSLRHLAWAGDGHRRVLGIALQAEHDEPAQRAAAPVLALFDGTVLQAASSPTGRTLAGYGGDIASAHGRFAVSCPRAGGVAWFRDDGGAAGWQPLPEACPLAASPTRSLWMGGRSEALAIGPAGSIHRNTVPSELRLDNHWLLL